MRGVKKHISLINNSHAIFLSILVAGSIFLHREIYTYKKLGGRFMFIFGAYSPRS